MYPNLWIIVPAFVVGVTSRFEHSTRERHRHTITSCLNVLCCDGFCSRCNILMERTLLMHSVCCWFSESFCVIVGAQENNYFSLPFFCADCRYKGTHTEMFHFHLLSGLTCCSSFFFFISEAFKFAERTPHSVLNISNVLQCYLLLCVFHFRRRARGAKWSQTISRNIHF